MRVQTDIRWLQLGGRLGDGTDIVPTDSWRLLSGWDGAVLERAPCGYVVICWLCDSSVEHWRLEGENVVLSKVQTQFG